MAYEIPQQLEYKEKIMFGLTFPQLGWAFLFAIPTFWVLLLKGNIWVNGTFALAIVAVGSIFVFGDVPLWSKWISQYVRHKKILKENKKLNVLHNIKEIKEDCIITDKKIALLEIQSLNFNIKTDTEKETIIIGFQKFLNSFDFPIQFVVTTQNLSLERYFSLLAKRKKNKKLFESFQKFIAEYIKSSSMKNRRFYLVIPDDSNLDIQCKVVLERLKSMGLLARRLNDDQLINHLTIFFNGELVKRSLSSDYISDIVGLEKVETNLDHLLVNGRFNRIISAVGYPRSVESGFLDKIISMEGDFDISIHIEPFNIQTMMVQLNRELQKQRADLYAEELKGSINPSLEIKYSDTRKILEELQKGEEKLFMVSLYINCKAGSLEELNLLTKKVETELNSGLILPQTPLLRQLDGYRSMVPVGNNVLAVRRNVPTKALSAFFPFTSPFLQVEEQGIMLGLNRNNIPVIRDIFGLSNPNGLVLATSGAGKSYFTKLLILRQIMNGTKVIIIDPQSEYLDLVKSAKGQIVTISRESETIINLLDLMGHDFLEKRLSLMDLFKIMFGDLTDVQKSILDRALTECYASKGITVDIWYAKEPPLLEDLYKTLVKMSKKASTMEQITYSALLNRLYIYTHGVFNFLNKQTSIDFDANLVCFDIGEMPKQVKPVVMFLMLDYVYMKMKESKHKKLLVIDEAWSLLSQASDASYIFEIVKTCRKYNMGMLLITQDVADLIDSKAGHAVLANTAYSLLLRQKPAIINDVVKAFSLSQSEKEYLLSAIQGSGILITDNDHSEISIVASPEEHKLITTNPNEKKKKKEEKKPEPKFDTLYLSDTLKPTEMNKIKNSGYQKGEFTGIGDSVKRNYLVKTTHPESSLHAFFVHSLAKYIGRYTDKIETPLTREPDVIFEVKGATYCIEVETGKHKDEVKKENKFSEAEAKFGNNCVVMITDHKLEGRYKKRTNLEIKSRKEIVRWIDGLFADNIYINKGEENAVKPARKSAKKPRKGQKTN